MSVVTPVSTVGSKKLPPSAWRLPPTTTLAPFCTASAMCSSTFSTAFMSISGPITTPGSTPLPTFIAPAASARRLRERVVDAVLHQDAVGADAGLAGIAVLRGDRALDRHLDVGVVEHDERRVAAEFQRDLLDRRGALLHQQFADLGRAGEGQLAHGRVGGHLAADLLGAAGDAGEDALRHAGALGQFAQRQRRERRLRSPASAPSCSRRPAPARPCG